MPVQPFFDVPAAPVLIYRITHVDNVAGLLAQGGPVCASAGGPGYVGIHHAHIQARRAAIRVPCGPGGSLLDYVPFYFAPRSPMLYAIHRGSVAGVSGGQDQAVFLVSSLGALDAQHVPFVFTDGHAEMDALSGFYDRQADLGRVNWPLMQAKYWFDTDDEPDRARQRQAECLAHRRVPLAALHGLAVRTAGAQARVRDALAAAIAAGHDVTGANGRALSCVLRPAFYFDP